MTPERPLVYIILVNWNGLSDTTECLASLSKITYPNAQVLVVDNGSRDDQAGALRGAFPAVTVLATGENLGFTGGNNVGIRRALSAGAEYVLCLNNDTTVAPDFLEPLVKALEDDPQAGIAGSKIFYYDQPEEVWFAGAVCRFDQESFAKRSGPAWHLPDVEQDRGEAPFEAQIVTGCSLLVRADLMRQLNGFDDRFFAYYEDVELNLRVEKMGLKRLVVPASRVWHKESRSTGGPMSPTAMFYLIRNTRLLAQLHAPGGSDTAEHYYLLYTRLWKKTVGSLVRGGKFTDRDMERMIFTHQAFWCAAKNIYGRRQSGTKLEINLRRRLTAKKMFYRYIDLMGVVWNATFMRVFWYLYHHLYNRHVMRKSSKPGVTVDTVVE